MLFSVLSFSSIAYKYECVWYCIPWCVVYEQCSCLDIRTVYQLNCNLKTMQTKCTTAHDISQNIWHLKMIALLWFDKLFNCQCGVINFVRFLRCANESISLSKYLFVTIRMQFSMEIKDIHFLIDVFHLKLKRKHIDSIWHLCQMSSKQCPWRNF